MVVALLDGETQEQAVVMVETQAVAVLGMGEAILRPTAVLLVAVQGAMRLKLL